MRLVRLVLVPLSTVLAAALLPGSAEAQPPLQPQPEVTEVAEPAPEPRRPAAFVSPDWLARHLHDEDLRVLDVRLDPHAYLRGHVPGAVHLADATTRAPRQGVPAQPLPPQDLAFLFQRAGVRNRDRVVVYSEGDDVVGATAVAWTLRSLGLEEVYVLDGGVQAWAKTRRLTQRYPEYRVGTFTVRRQRDVRATLNDVRDVLQGEDPAVLVDARPPEAYRGEVDTWMRNGHVPGAVNLPWRSLVEEDNPHQLKPLSEVRRLVQAQGLDPDDEIILYGGTSREASLLFHVLRAELGYPNVRLYEGSWTEYAGVAELPVARAEERAASR